MMQRKSGFTPITWAMLDSQLSGDAALLLMRMRRLSDDNESNGCVEPREIAALIALHGLRKRAVMRSLDELVALGLLENEGNGYRDVEFSIVCRTHEQRVEKRRQWQEYQQTRRIKAEPSSDTPISTVDTQETPQRVNGSVSASPSPSPSPSLALAPSLVGPLPADALTNGAAAYPPSQVDSTMVARTWESIKGGSITPAERGHIQGWLTQYGANAIVGYLKRVHEREAARGNVISRLAYFDAGLREANDGAKPSPRYAPVRGIGEPPEPVAS